MDELTLGRKLYAFREERKISQTKVEVETGLSFGTISRIENGAINPTKETLQRISTFLQLDSSEFTYLIGFNTISPTEKEANGFVEQIEQSISKTDFPAYIMDSTFHVWMWNKSILEIFGISPEKANEHIGESYMKILFSPDLKIVDKIPPNIREEVLQKQVFRYRKMISKYRLSNRTIEEVNELKLQPLFSKYWNEYNSYDNDLAFGEEFCIRYKDQTLSIQINMNIVQKDSRFFLVRYFPMDHKTAKIFEVIKKK